MKNLLKVTLALAILIALSCATSQAQVQLSTTTLGAAITTNNQTNVTLSSTSTMQSQSVNAQPNTVLYIDKELMFVTTVIDSTHVTVQRAKGTGAGGRPAQHVNGALVYFSITSGNTPAPSYFSNGAQFSEVSGACTATLNLVLPKIYVYDGNVWNCYSGQWFLQSIGTTGASGDQVTNFCTGTVGSAETEFLNGAACSGATTATARRVMTGYGTLANLQVVSSANALGTGGTATTVFKNGTATAITCSFAAATKVCVDNTHSVPVIPGDVITFQNISATSDTAANVAAAVGLY